MRFIWIAAAICAVAVASPARAEWLKASSRHFNIYSDGSAETVRTLATRLEQVDAALRIISGVEDGAEGAANPVTVYVLPSSSAVQRLTGGRNVAGVYYGRASGSVAFTPRRGGDNELDPQIVLFHEYAHHFLLAQSDIAYPAWLSEGYAEFVSTARFPKEGVMLGAPAQHRAWGLLGTQKLPIRTLLAPGARLTDQQTDQVYGRGWLLTHYLFFGGTRQGQMAKYLAALNNGAQPLDAATQGFGDLKQLDRDLDAYLNASRITVRTIGHARLPTIKVDVRPLTPGERALIAMRMTSTRGVDAATAAPLYARAVRAAAPFPNDAVAQGWLAEMAYDAGKDDEAEAAADRALAADPRSVQALLYKGMVRLRRAAIAKAAADNGAWKEARSWIVKANRVDTNAAAPLLLFYDSFAMADAKPSKSAVVGLHRAQELAPQDEALRFRSARQSLLDGEVAHARRTLRPLAFSAHAPPDNAAARLLAMLEKGSTGPAALAAIEAEAKAAAEKAEKEKAAQ